VLGCWSTLAYDRDLLAALLGSTRAALLVAAAGGETTSGLAQRLGVSVAATSQQLAVLRNAGLVASTRQGRAVCHDLTPLGVRLLLASGPFSQG
jgi:DNA-binding transcriptional ArsR family regulator